jgi:hypothetical protein
VRSIFERYLEIGSYKGLVSVLQREGAPFKLGSIGMGTPSAVS